jgi:hypothetical protein
LFQRIALRTSIFAKANGCTQGLSGSNFGPVLFRKLSAVPGYWILQATYRFSVLDLFERCWEGNVLPQRKTK